MPTHFIKIIFFLFLALTISSCGNKNNTVTVEREPTDRLIQKLGKEDYSIVLNDMNIIESSGVKRFQHKYNILKVVQDSLIVDSLDWKTVNRPFFEKHENDLGMEIVSHHDGKLSRVAQPVGFGWAIGNEKHGSWEPVKKDSAATASTGNNGSQQRWTSNGTSLLFLYWMMRRPAYNNNYNGYKTAAASGKPYYGTATNGTTQYGTRSTYEKNNRSSFFSRKKASSTWSSHSKEKTTRSSSRYKSSSSTRSRSGGSGK